MIVKCGNRRLVSDRFGWNIEIRHQVASGENAGEVRWKLDRPAHPSTLADGLQMIFERILNDQNDEIDVHDLAVACDRAATAVIISIEKVRKKGEKNV